VRMADATNGVAGSLGFFGLICGSYTNDGKEWVKSHEGTDLICAAQGAAAPDPQTFILVGQWASPRQPNGDGVQISLDAGATWKGEDWNQGTSARYASFLSKDFGYVTGGQWPENNSDILLSSSRQLTRRLRFNGKNVELTSRDSIIEAGWQGIIAKATTAATTWTTMVNLTNQVDDMMLYFNQISCTDENTCWAVGEGINTTTNNDASWIFATSDGWQTWDRQLDFQSGSLNAIQMLNATYGWAAGALITQNGEEPLGLKGAFYQTMDGKTWNLAGTLMDFYAFDLSMIDEFNGFSAGISIVGLSSLARYSPSK